jgi:DNA-directed RNA polymerase beta' subunit
MAVITITSEYFAGGQRVASGIADKLGFEFIGDRLVAEVAKELNMSEHEAKTFLKPGGSSLMRYLDKYTCSVVQKVVDREHGCLDDSAYYEKTRELVEKIYKNENAVILGWGAQCILQKKPETFHVLLKKQADKKLAQVMEAKNIGQKQAEKLIKEDEEEKKAYIRKYFETDWQDPSLYNLIIDMEDYTIETAVGLIADKSATQISPVNKK